MILENVTLEARARAQLSKRPSATAFSIADRMTRGGLLVEDIVVDEYAASSMTPRASHTRGGEPASYALCSAIGPERQSRLANCVSPA